MTDLIEEAAKAHWNAMRSETGRKWEELSEVTRAVMYDAMHAALHKIRLPTREMVVAGQAVIDGGKATGPVIDQMSAAMMDKLLEVK